MSEIQESTDDGEFWWNTSKGLRARFPRISKPVSKWSRFIEIYDQPKFRELRKKEWEVSSPSFFISTELIKLRALAEKTLGSDSQLSLPNGITNEGAGKLLASKILQILSGQGTSLDELAEYTNHASKAKDPPQRSSRDVLWAMIQFISREERLPLQKELNIESLRLIRLVHSPEQTFAQPFGEIVQYGSSDYRIYTANYLCPNSIWNDCRWEKSQYSKLLAHCGLSGL